MDKVLKDEIKESLKKGETAIFIFDRMAAKGADPSEVRGELMKGVERKLIIDPYQMGPTLPVPPKPERDIFKIRKYVSKIPKLSKNTAFIAGGVFIFLLIILILSNIEVSVEVNEDGHKIPKGSYYGKIDFLEVMNTSVLDELYPEAEISYNKSVSNEENYKKYVFVYTVEGRRDTDQFTVEIRDYISSEYSDSKLKEEYKGYSLNIIGLSSYPTVVEKYDKLDLFKAVFDLHIESGYENVYIASEENFFYKVTASYERDDLKEEKDETTYFAGNRFRGVTNQLIRT